MSNTEELDVFEPVRTAEDMFRLALLLAYSRCSQRTTRQDVTDALTEWAQQCDDAKMVAAVMSHWEHRKTCSDAEWNDLLRTFRAA